MASRGARDLSRSCRRRPEPQVVVVGVRDYEGRGVVAVAAKARRASECSAEETPGVESVGEGAAPRDGQAPGAQPRDEVDGASFSTSASASPQASADISSGAVAALRRAVQILERFTPFWRFGWAFLLVWVFCIFYTNVVDGYTGSLAQTATSLWLRLFYVTAPVFSSVVMLIVIVASEKRFGSPTQHPVLFIVAPLATAVATLLLFWQLPSALATEAVFGLGSLLTGFGSALLWVMWGEYYARITQEEVEFLAPTSTVLAAVMALLVTAMDGWVALATVALFPVLSGLCLILAWKDAQSRSAIAEYKDAEDQQAFSQAHAAARSNLSHVLASVGRDGFGILAACLFVCLVGSFWAAPAKDSLEMQLVFVVSIAFMLIVSVSATRGPRRVSLAFLYRWMCPAVVAGFAAIIVAGENGGTYVAFVVAIAARFAFCLITQMYFARIAVQGTATPVQAYGLGWIFVHSGDFLGTVVLVLSEEAVSAALVSVDQVAAVSMALLVASTMFVLNDEHSFRFDMCTTSAQPAKASEGVEIAENADAKECEGVMDTWVSPEDDAAKVGGSSAEARGPVGADGAAGFAAAASAEPAQTADAVGPDKGRSPKAAAGGLEASAGAAAADLAGEAAAPLSSLTSKARLSPASDGLPSASDGEPARADRQVDELSERVAQLAREAGLTPRETEVFGLLARGRSIPYIRDALVISRETAATHAKHIYAKLGVHSRQELIDLIR